MGSLVGRKNASAFGRHAENAARHCSVASAGVAASGIKRIYMIYIWYALRGIPEGEGNRLTILTDPKWATPLLVLVDALIATYFFAIASFAVNTITSVVFDALADKAAVA